MTDNLLCLILNHKWVEDASETRVAHYDGDRQVVSERKSVCSRKGCTAQAWDYVEPA